MVYRAAIDGNNIVICIGRDENQSGAYHDMGTWCDFTFDVIPSIPSDVRELVGDRNTISLLKVEDDEIVPRTLAEVEAALLE